MLWKIDGYLAIPHELLHVLAYRLIGKKCRYRLGDHFVYPGETRSWVERLFVLLFPLMVISGLGLFSLSLWVVTYLLNDYPPHPLGYFAVAPTWHKYLWVAAIVLLLYAGSCIGDTHMVLGLLFQKLRHQPPHQSNH